MRTYCIAPRALLTALWWPAGEGSPRGRDICICCSLADAFCRTAETDTELQSNWPPIQILKESPFASCNTLRSVFTACEAWWSCSCSNRSGSLLVDRLCFRKRTSGYSQKKKKKKAACRAVRLCLSVLSWYFYEVPRGVVGNSVWGKKEKKQASTMLLMLLEAFTHNWMNNPNLIKQSFRSSALESPCVFWAYGYNITSPVDSSQTSTDYEIPGKDLPWTEFEYQKIELNSWFSSKRTSILWEEAFMDSGDPKSRGRVGHSHETQAELWASSSCPSPLSGEEAGQGEAEDHSPRRTSLPHCHSPSSVGLYLCT